jgi:hypothetical protein
MGRAMRASDLRYERESRQHDLVIVMRAYGARLGTVMQWTGLSRYRVQSLSRYYERTSPEDTRRRGISPSQTAFFGKSLRIEAESLAFALIAYEHNVIPASVSIGRVLPDVERGWRLIDAYETYIKMVPGAQIELERAVLLIGELTRRNVMLRYCQACHDVMVIERFGPPHDRCPFCRSGSEMSSGRAPPLSVSE